MRDDVELVNGFLWPKADTECRRVAFDWSSDLQQVYPYVTDWSVCVQAGGNCGVWPKALAARFGTVYTFEPDPLNFYCLAHNVTEPNVVKMQAVLGAGGQPRTLEGDAANCGAHYVGGAGRWPNFQIDWLHLPSCGLIYLDIEGFELQALFGAMETIRAYRPVICIENKGHSERYGKTRDEVEEWVAGRGYVALARPHRDVVFVDERRFVDARRLR